MYSIISLVSRIFERKKNKHANEFAEYTDFYLDFVENLETRATQKDDLPGFADYHRMLKTFIKSQPLILDNDIVEGKEEIEEAQGSHDDNSYIKVANWLKYQQGVYTTETPTFVASLSHYSIKDGSCKFCDVHSFIDHHSSRNPSKNIDNVSDNLFYACGDVTALNQIEDGVHKKISWNTSFESCGATPRSSGWEVTRRPTPPPCVSGVWI